MGSDVKDMLGLTGTSTSDLPLTKDAILSDKKKKQVVAKPKKKPKGISREVWGLMWSDDKNAAAPLVPSEVDTGYKQNKAVLGIGARVRPWTWQPFTNPARQDGLVLYHWRRKCSETKEYPFARFNKSVGVNLTYTDTDYAQCVAPLGDTVLWSREATDHLFELCRRFDLRFIVIHDRWDTTKFGQRSIEDLKQRFYTVHNALVRARDGSNAVCAVYDADHERRRKLQLQRLAARTQAEVDEEQELLAELKKIELRKKERERKQADLQKILLAAAVDKRPSVAGTAAAPSAPTIKKSHHRGAGSSKRLAVEQVSDSAATIRFPELKPGSGPTLRSHLMKFPPTIGTKKVKAIEQMLDELGVEAPVARAATAMSYNALRQDIALIYELQFLFAQAARTSCEFELKSLRHQRDVRGEDVSELDSVLHMLASPPRKTEQHVNSDDSITNINTVFNGLKKIPGIDNDAVKLGFYNLKPTRIHDS